MVRIILCGCNGKMGSVISNLVDKNENMILKCGVDKINNLYINYKKEVLYLPFL